MGETKMTRYERYEAMKRDWTSRNPAATAEEYQLAMRLIADACGI